METKELEEMANGLILEKLADVEKYTRFDNEEIAEFECDGENFIVLVSGSANLKNFEHHVFFDHREPNYCSGTIYYALDVEIVTEEYEDVTKYDFTGYKDF